MNLGLNLIVLVSAFFGGMWYRVVDGLSFGLC